MQTASAFLWIGQSESADAFKTIAVSHLCCIGDLKLCDTSINNQPLQLSEGELLCMYREPLETTKAHVESN